MLAAPTAPTSALHSRDVDPGLDVMAMRTRRMTLPSINGREDPIFKPATKPCSDPGHSAAFILVHGLGDDARGLEDIVDQFQRNHKLPYMHWILPNALENPDVMGKAWYHPSAFSPFASSRPELDDPEDEAGMLRSRTYLESLIDACVNKGIPPHRIVLGGFSQGCAMSLLTDLTSSKYSGRLAGVVGLMGYLPLAQQRRIQHLRAAQGLPPVVGETPMFLARGAKDGLIPKRIWTATLRELQDLGLNDGAIEAREYEGLGHSLNGVVLRDMCTWLERVVPRLED